MKRPGIFRGWLSSLLLSLFSIVVSVTFVEGMARMLLPPVEPAIAIIDDRYLFKLVPNASKTFYHNELNGGGAVRYHINSLGFRGEELRNREEGMRIIVYGDSFILAEQVSLADTFTEQLEKNLGPNLQRPIEVLNAGVIAYGPDQISLRIEDEIDTLRPDLIVVAVFATNDFGDLIRNKIYRIGPEGDLLLNTYTIGKAVHANFKARHGIYDVNSFLDRLMIVRKFKEAYWKRKERIQIDGVDPAKGDVFEQFIGKAKREYDDYLKSDEVTDFFSDGYDADIAFEPDSPSARTKRELMGKVLKNIQEAVQSRDIPLALLFIPAPVDVCREYELTVSRDLHPEYVNSRATDVLEEIARRHDIPYINLFGPFEEADCCSLYYHHGEFHWNEAGQALAARITADYILGNNLLGATEQVR